MANINTFNEIRTKGESIDIVRRCRDKLDTAEAAYLAARNDHYVVNTTQVEMARLHTAMKNAYTSYMAARKNIDFWESAREVAAKEDTARKELDRLQEQRLSRATLSWAAI